MSDWRELADEMDVIEYFYLRTITTTAGWGLGITVQEALPRLWPENPERDFEPSLAKSFRAQMLAQPNPQPRAFEISFREAICYLVQNESYGLYPQSPEIFTGKLFRIFTNSHLLDLAARTTYARGDHPGPEAPQHFSVVCQDDIVDVIACMKPHIRRVDPE